MSKIQTQLQHFTIIALPLESQNFWIFEILLMLNLGVCTGCLKVKYHYMYITPDELDFINEFRPKVKKIN